jgi:hypothetical protein
MYPSMPLAAPLMRIVMPLGLYAMAKTLVQSISEWLDDGGYPLELYAVKTLRELGFYCYKSPFFTDNESKKPREIDIIAEIYTNKEKKHFLTFRLVIECKKSANPFVVLCDKQDEKALLENVLFGNLWVGSRDDMFVAAPFIMAEGRSFSNLFPTPCLNQPTRLGYTLVQAHHKNDSNIYAEVYKLAKAYYYEIQKWKNYREKEIKNAPNKTSRKEMIRHFYSHIAVLVVDAPLVEVYLDEFGTTQIIEKEISSVELRLPWKLKQEGGLGIAIVTKSKFADFARDTAVLAKELANRSMAKGKIAFVPLKEEA